MLNASRQNIAGAVVKPTTTMNVSESLSTTVFDYKTNYSMSMSNMSSLSDMDHSLAQIKVVLDIFQEDNLVLGEPANTVIIAMYCILVTIAGNETLSHNIARL